MRFCIYHKQFNTFIYDSYFQRVFKTTSLRKKEFLNELKKLQEPAFGIHDEGCSVRINPGNSCNLRCKYCFAHKSTFDKKQEIKIILDSLDWMINNNTESSGYWIMYSLTGETFLNTDGLELFMRKIQEYKDLYPNKWFGYFFQTNGTILNGNILKLLHQYKIKDLTISLDGNENVNDAFRIFPDGKGTYKIISGNIKKLESEKITVSISGVITSRFPHPYKLITSYAKMENISKICMRPVRDKKYDIKRNQYPLLFLEYNRIYKLLENQIKKGNYILFNKLKNDYMLEPLKYLVKQQKIVSRCSFDHQLSIDKNGDIYPCDYTYGIKEFKMGSIYDKEKIIKPQNFEQLVQNKKCIKCNFKYLCGGTCYYQSFIKYKNLSSIDNTECKYRKFLIKRSLQFYCKLLMLGFTEKQISDFVNNDFENEQINVNEIWSNISLVHKDINIVFQFYKKEILLFTNYSKKLFIIDDKNCLDLFLAKDKRIFIKKIHRISVKKAINFNESLVEILNQKNSKLLNKASRIEINNFPGKEKFEKILQHAKAAGERIILTTSKIEQNNMVTMAKYFVPKNLLHRERKCKTKNNIFKYKLDELSDYQFFLKYNFQPLENFYILLEVKDYELMKKFSFIQKINEILLKKGFKTELNIIFTKPKNTITLFKRVISLNTTNLTLDTVQIHSEKLLINFYKKLYSMISQIIINEQDYSLFIKLKDDLSIRLYLNLISKKSEINYGKNSNPCENCFISSFCVQEATKCKHLKLIAQECIKFGAKLILHGIKPKNFYFLQYLD